MQKNTKKRGAILSAVIAAAVMVIYLGCVIFAAVTESFGDVVGYIFLTVFALIILAVIWGVFVALRQRLQEIEKGEEEDARKY